MKKQKQICIQCGKTREEIKKGKLYCCTISSTEDSSEVDQEWLRHRFKPYSNKELDLIAKEEKEICNQMGEMAEFLENNLLK